MQPKLHSIEPLKTLMDAHDAQVWNLAMDTIANRLADMDYPASWRAVLTACDKMKIETRPARENRVREKPMSAGIIRYWREDDLRWSAQFTSAMGNTGPICGNYSSQHAAQRAAVGSYTCDFKDNFSRSTSRGKMVR